MTVARASILEVPDSIVQRMSAFLDPRDRAAFGCASDRIRGVIFSVPRTNTGLNRSIHQLSDHLLKSMVAWLDEESRNAFGRTCKRMRGIYLKTPRWTTKTEKSVAQRVLDASNAALQDPRPISALYRLTQVAVVGSSLVATALHMYRNNDQACGPDYWRYPIIGPCFGLNRQWCCLFLPAVTVAQICLSGIQIFLPDRHRVTEVTAALSIVSVVHGVYYTVYGTPFVGAHMCAMGILLAARWPLTNRRLFTITQRIHVRLRVRIEIVRIRAERTWHSPRMRAVRACGRRAVESGVEVASGVARRVLRNIASFFRRWCPRRKTE